MIRTWRIKITSALFAIEEFGLTSEGNSISIKNRGKLIGSIEKLVRFAVLAEGEIAAWAQYLIHACALQLGIIPSSINDLYILRGKGEIPPVFTTPAINLRALAFDASRAVFRSARKVDSGLMIFEIARVELIWGGMTLGEYAACVLAAAIAEGYSGPVFLQGDHFQVSASQPLEDEKAVIKNLIRQAIEAGFYNIDIDTSTLVNLSKSSIDDQQEQNARTSAELAVYTRKLQPAGVTISIGGEIGEVGGHISTTDELNSYLTQFNRLFTLDCTGQPGLSKVSIHTGTTHGGIILPDGSISKAKIDFDAIQRISKTGQRDYHIGGIVQHGASTLPYEEFGQLLKAGTLEVHLATSIMTSMLEHLPLHLLDRIHDWLKTNYSQERAKGMTDGQFYHKVEMHALAPFKNDLWNLPEDVKSTIAAAWESQFDQMFSQLGCANTRQLIGSYIHPVKVPPVFRATLSETIMEKIEKGLVG
jgi:fructose/tagatose bisphosphate aldolase